MKDQPQTARGPRQDPIDSIIVPCLDPGSAQTTIYSDWFHFTGRIAAIKFEVAAALGLTTVTCVIQDEDNLQIHPRSGNISVGASGFSLDWPASRDDRGIVSGTGVRFVYTLDTAKQPSPNQIKAAVKVEA